MSLQLSRGVFSAQLLELASSHALQDLTDFIKTEAKLPFNLKQTPAELEKEEKADEAEVCHREPLLYSSDVQTIRRIPQSPSKMHTD